MASDLVIRADGLGKMYRLYHARRDRLKQFALPKLQRLAGIAPKDYYQGFWALRDVSFEVRAGETVGVVGPNGSGKSTLLQIICGILNQTAGTVETRGRIAALLELGSGFNPDFTGRENVYVNGALLGLKKAEIDRRLDDIAAFAEIGEFLDQPVKTYSSGMVLRLAFSVVANVNADILVVDEALAVGDFLFTQKCMRFLRDFKKRGTIFFVSHDTNAVTGLCDRALFLNKGVLAAAGPADEVVGRYVTAMYEESQVVNGIPPGAAERPEPPKGGEVAYRDVRTDANAANALTEGGLHPPSNRDFGTGLALVESVYLTDASQVSYPCVAGGEDVVLEIRCRAHGVIEQAVVGFAIKDRLGQALFTDSTYLVYLDRVPRLKAGTAFRARFEFRMPLLTIGDYSIDAMVWDTATGTGIYHHWAHDVYQLKVQSGRTGYGMMGIPMKNIVLSVDAP